jgi:hypothetical protein
VKGEPPPLPPEEQGETARFYTPAAASAKAVGNASPALGRRKESSSDASCFTASQLNAG